MDENLLSLDEFVRTLTDITDKELGKPCTNGLPPVIRLDKVRYRVGPYSVEKVGEMWVTDNIEFTTVQSAMMFCVYTYTNSIDSANKIRALDENVQRLVAEKRMYEKHISTSIKKKDGWKIDLFTAKCSNISAHLNQAMSDLRQALRVSMRMKFKKLTLMIK
jgi:hypothetical protein